MTTSALQKIAYVMLLVLVLGATTGALTGAF